MIWAAWRTQRPQCVVALGATAALVVWLLAGGLEHESGWSQLTNHGVDVVLYCLPGVLGLAIGAPLIAGELAGGTERLAWTQGVSWKRWLATKLLVGGAVTSLLVAAFVPLLRWWTGTAQPEPDITPKLFAITGVVGIGYGLAAFALGAALGALLGRPAWAFASALPMVILARLMVDALAPTLVAPAVAVVPSSESVWTLQSDAHVLNEAYLPLRRTAPAPGQTWQGEATRTGTWRLMAHCVGNAETPIRTERLKTCAAAAHLHLVVQYQPESHHWPLQGAETLIYLAAAAILAAAGAVAVRRRHKS